MSGRTITKLLAVDDYVVVDTETTGLSVRSCEIIELGALKYRNGECIAEFNQLIKPELFPIPDFIESLTGIDSSMLEDKPSIADVIDDFVDFIGELPIVGHNVCFDKAFIEDAYGEPLKCSFIDTKRIARHVLELKSGYGLSNVYGACAKISPSAIMGHSKHRALSDCETAASCYEVLKPLLVEKFGCDPEKGYEDFKKANAKKYKHAPTKKVSDYVPTVDEVDDSNPFYGSSICFTGKLQHYTRDEAIQQVVNLGAIPKNGVSSKLDYLVLGSFDFIACLNGKKSSKLKKAEAFIEEGAPIQIVSEDFLIDLIS